MPQPWNLAIGNPGKLNRQVAYRSCYKGPGPYRKVIQLPHDHADLAAGAHPDITDGIYLFDDREGFRVARKDFDYRAGGVKMSL